MFREREREIERERCIHTKTKKTCSTFKQNSVLKKQNKIWKRKC